MDHRYQQLSPILDVSRETMGRLDRFVGLFLKWSRSINLAAPSTLSDIWSRHVADSLQIFALNPGPRNWIDLGSGGGFPGIITAILLLETDGGFVDLVESNQKKSAFLRTALLETGARGAVHTTRIDRAAQTISGPDAVSARALADLDTLLAMASPWMASGATGWFHKGRDYRREIENARRSWSFDLVEHRSKIDENSVILQIERLQSLGAEADRSDAAS